MVYRENFKIVNFAQNFFMDFYICWLHANSFSAKFPMRQISPSPILSQSPLSGPFLQRGEISGLIFIKIFKRQTKNPAKIYVKVIGTGVWISLTIFFENFLIIFLKWKYFAGQKITSKFPDLQSKILLNKCHFWQFSIPHRHVKRYGKFSNHSIFAPCGLCKSGNQKVPKTKIFYIWRFH